MLSVGTANALKRRGYYNYDNKSFDLQRIKDEIDVNDFHVVGIGKKRIEEIKEHIKEHEKKKINKRHFIKNVSYKMLRFAKNR